MRTNSKIHAAFIQVQHLATEYKNYKRLTSKCQALINFVIQNQLSWLHSVKIDNAYLCKCKEKELSMSEIETRQKQLFSVLLNPMLVRMKSRLQSPIIRYVFTQSLFSFNLHKKTK